jgi:2-methylisocitrate lyase-like PEP mutase family enzyme
MGVNGRQARRAARRKRAYTMTRTARQKRARFRELHRDGCPWAVGSARILEHLGFEAQRTTSTGFAWATGRLDYALSRDEVLGHLAAPSAAVNVPVNSDIESGFAAGPVVPAANERLALDTCVAGLSIKDRALTGSGLFDILPVVECVRDARHAIDQSGEDVVIVARTEILLSAPSADLDAMLGPLGRARRRIDAPRDARASDSCST